MKGALGLSQSEFELNVELHAAWGLGGYWLSEQRRRDRPYVGYVVGVVQDVEGI